MLTASIVLALALTPGRFLKLERAWYPSPPPSAAASYNSIEVTIGALPPGLGGAPDEAVLKAARLPLKGDILLDFFRKRTPPAPPPERIEALIKRLGDAAGGDAAQDELVAIGLPAAPLLRSTINNADDPEAARRARAAMALLEGDAASGLVIHAARALATTKPAGAAKALLEYLPFAEDNNSYQEIQAALHAVALRDGKIDPALIAALKDRNAIRRSTAAQAISAVGGSAHYGILRPLLKDAKSSVRLGVALALVDAYDAEA